MPDKLGVIEFVICKLCRGDNDEFLRYYILISCRLFFSSPPLRLWRPEMSLIEWSDPDKSRVKVLNKVLNDRRN